MGYPVVSCKGLQSVRWQARLKPVVTQRFLVVSESAVGKGGTWLSAIDSSTRWFQFKAAQMWLFQYVNTGLTKLLDHDSQNIFLDSYNIQFAVK
jgi:hypothetical protein